jgi:hypothetical protein
MTVRARALTIKLLEQQKKHPEYFEKLGISITIHPIENVPAKGGREQRV